MLLGLDEDSRTTIRIGGFLHDVGKIGIADAVLLKPGRLTDEEMAEMRRHSEIGAAIVSTHEAMAGIARIVRHHHERWDGGGYPDRLAGGTAAGPMRGAFGGGDLAGVSLPRSEERGFSGAGRRRAP